MDEGTLHVYGCLFPTIQSADLMFHPVLFWLCQPPAIFAQCQTKASHTCAKPHGWRNPLLQAIVFTQLQHPWFSKYPVTASDKM